ncbi:MAG: hypothetical protein WCI67_02135 [Chloroflexales bacterium]
MRRYLLAGLAALLTALSAAWPANAQIEVLCFPETGQCISGQIRYFWEHNGGLPVFGYPVGPQHQEFIQGQPYQVQWFERFRMELHPENLPPYNVLLGRMGADRLTEQGRDPSTAFARSTPQAGCSYFAQTEHNVCGAVLAYWKSKGLSYYGTPGVAADESLGLWGLPLSDLTTETLSDGQTYQVQWFERARLEIHPENTPPYTILGGLLGREILANQAATPAPVLKPTPAPPLAQVCSALPEDGREAIRQGIRITAGNWDYRTQIEDANAGASSHYLTFDIEVFNMFYRRSDGSPDRFFVNLHDLLLVDRQGRSLTPDATTNLLGDRFVGGQVRPTEVRGGRLAYQVPNDFIPAKLIFHGEGYPRVEVDLKWPCP